MSVSANPARMRTLIQARGWWAYWRRSTQMEMMRWNALSTRPGLSLRRRRSKQMILTSKPTYWSASTFTPVQLLHTCHSTSLFYAFLYFGLLNAAVKEQCFLRVFIRIIIPINKRSVDYHSILFLQLGPYT